MLRVSERVEWRAVVWIGVHGRWQTVLAVVMCTLSGEDGENLSRYIQSMQFALVLLTALSNCRNILAFKKRHLPFA